jgi:UDP-N-acetylmuramate dehydrogenase
VSGPARQALAAPAPLRPGPADPAALDDAHARLAASCGDRVSRDLALAPLTTFRLGGPASLFLRAESVEDLAALAETLAAVPLPLLIVGRGSNLLVADAGWPGVALHLGQRFRGIRVEGDELQAGAATPLPSVASRSAAAELGGLAFAVAIPGSVGGGVRMNAGAHGSELADRMLWAEVVQLAGGGSGGLKSEAPTPVVGGHPQPSGSPPVDQGSGGLKSEAPTPVVGNQLEPSGSPPVNQSRPEPRRLRPEELGFGYRRSALPPAAVVTAARFALEPASEAAVRAEIDEARRWRRDNQPVNQPNCGSVFANPAEMAAGRVVELLGMKGERVGGARVSEVHANFIVAADGARSADVLELIRRVVRRAQEQLGITLRTEVQLVGDFDAGPPGGTA